MAAENGKRAIFISLRPESRRESVRRSCTMWVMRSVSLMTTSRKSFSVSRLRSSPASRMVSA